MRADIPPRRFVVGALRAFARNGYAGTTMDDIAAEIGVTQPRVSQVFAGKLAAYLDAHQVAMDTFCADLRGAESSKKFDPGTVHAVVDRLLTDSPHIPMIVARSLIPVEHEPRLVVLAGETYDRMIEVLRDLGATEVQARATFGDVLLTLVERFAQR